MNQLERLRALRSEDSLTSDQIFEAVFEAASKISEHDREDDSALEIAIRLLEAQRNGQVPKDCGAAIDFLVEECGLYQYVRTDRFDLLTQTVIEAHAVHLQNKLYLHSKQMQILLWLLGGHNVILSAPTSFGKSLLVDAYLAKKHPQNVVIILPTIALIDETRRRLLRNFGGNYRIITTPYEEYDPSYATIFVLTQERFLQRKEQTKIDFLFIDEFYKLDPSRGDSRYETLNLALYKALPLARQTFMAGPHIRNIELGDKWSGNFRFVRTDYRTVTVNVIDRPQNEHLYESFLTDLKGVGDESSLVFTAAPGTAESLMERLLKDGVSYSSKIGPRLSSWIERNYHPAWPVAHGSEAGMAVHHGRLPRSLGQLFVHLFDRGEFKLLICTSTLIEGVNTAAANVFIYDKKINRTDFDFFSFANIRGRVGRMMRHFVGNVFLYHQPPREVETNVDVPVLKDPSAATDFLIMNVDGDELSQDGRVRQQSLPLSTGISADVLKEHANLGTDTLIALDRQINVILREQPRLLTWAGFPSREQRVAAAELCLLVASRRRQRTGVHTSRKISWAWDQLRRISTFPRFLRWFVQTYFPGEEEKGVDAAFQFLQACEFNFPRTLAAVEALVVKKSPPGTISYGAYITEMENWFRPRWMKDLDEAGIPLPLVERLAPRIGSPVDRTDAIARIRQLDASFLDEVDKFIVAFGAA